MMHELAFFHVCDVYMYTISNIIHMYITYMHVLYMYMHNLLGPRYVIIACKYGYSGTGSAAATVVSRVLPYL